MAIFSGKSGTMSYGGTSFNVTNWSLTINDTTPSTAHSASSGWEVALSGVKSWSATVSFLQDDGSTPIGISGSQLTIGDAAELILGDGQNTYTGNAVLASLVFDCDMTTGAIMGGTAEFRGNGAMTVAA